MTEYFEVHARDGAARVGELRLRDSVSTPAIADDVVVDGGGLVCGPPTATSPRGARPN